MVWSLFSTKEREITNDEKGKISHRGNAIRLLKEYLEGEQHV